MSGQDGSTTQEAIIGRIANDAVAYANTTGDGPSISITRDAVSASTAHTLTELGFHVGAHVSFTYDSSTGLAADIRLLDRPELYRDDVVRGDDVPLPDPPPLEDIDDGAQFELDPGQRANVTRRFMRAFSKDTMKFGQLIDTETLLPGDLLLTREGKPDDVGRMIVDTQSNGGYTDNHARWTHAAMYVGDGTNVIESTFETLFDAGVRLTSFDSYCQGAHFLRFRRPRHFKIERDGWRTCVCAMAKLNRSYDFRDALSMWFKVRFRKKSFNSKDVRRSDSEMVICSTLYADAYNEATRRSLGEINGICVPAWLSLSDEFKDVAVSWVGIKQ
jgi:hypothetical protein